MKKPESTPTSALVTTSAPPASLIDQLVRERLPRLAELVRKEGAPYPLTTQLVNVWVDVFARAHLNIAQVEAAFDRAERHVKFWPSPGEVLGFISVESQEAELLAKCAEEEAAQKFEQVVAYAIRCSPDIPDRNPRRIKERTQRAINAAGGLDYLRDCDRESLQWARKRFIGAYLCCEELQEGEIAGGRGPRAARSVCRAEAVTC